MKSLIVLWQQVLIDMGTRCRISTSQDLKTVLARYEHEGLSFMTITLPSFASDLQKGLEAGKVDHTLFNAFAFQRGLPRFLGGFLDRVFDRSTGLLLDYPDVDCIFAMRQITMFLGKVLFPCSDKRVEQALHGYLECEQEVKRVSVDVSESLYSEFDRVVSLLWSDVFTNVDDKIYNGDLIPKHGPGKTVDRLLGNKKYDQTEWPDRMDELFSFGEYAIPNWRFKYLQDRVDFLEPGRERPVRVTPVPKTLKTPRIIAIEPTAMQYMQQAIAEVLVETIETDNLVGPMVGFTDQIPNREMACEGSLTKNLATLDLSEASDRVANQHVRRMVHRFPWLSQGLDVTRSRKADVPGHGVIRLAKYASMGSALCFPVEATFFLSVVFLGISRELSKPLTRGKIRSFHGKVRVYGDDIIVPVRYVRSVITALEDFGLRVNVDKSFWNGNFRESCGGDYYAGDNVTTIRCRNSLPVSRSNAKEIISAVSLRNQCYKAGLWGTARWLDNYMERLIPFPVVGAESPVLGKHSFLGYETQRLSPHTHSPQVKGLVVSPSQPPSQASGEGALLKAFLKRGSEPFADKEHLQRYGRAATPTLKSGWASAY
uniref:RNA-directed RNA polymerase n=1 Tax=Leviviridae sp. TaxID=2027243 RepID=A0A514D0C7_9VIRU|nr:MAG: RNA-dependent RNA polymerase [Leviviridae sp.]